MSNISDVEYNLLSQLSYLDNPQSSRYTIGNGKVKDYTVGNMVNYYLNHEKQTEGRVAMSSSEWDKTLQEIKDDPNLMNLKITGYTYQDSSNSKDLNPKENGLVAYCFETDDHKAVISYRGSETRDGIGAEDWYDNFKLAFESDTPQQKASLDFLNSMKRQYGYIDFSVTGHSKGGNNAEYVGVKSDDVTKCVAFDPPGFDFDFFRKNKDRIEGSKGKIVSYVSYLDMVSSILNNVAGKTNEIETPNPGEFPLYHKDNLFINPKTKEFYSKVSKPYDLSELQVLTDCLSQQVSEKDGMNFADGLYNVASGREGILALLVDKNFRESTLVLLPCLKEDLNVITVDYIKKTIMSNQSIPVKVAKIGGVLIVNKVGDFVLNTAEFLDASVCLVSDLAEFVKNSFETMRKYVAEFENFCAEKEKELEKLVDNKIDEIENDIKYFETEGEACFQKLGNEAVEVLENYSNVSTEAVQFEAAGVNSIMDAFGIGQHSVKTEECIKINTDRLRDYARRLSNIQRQAEEVSRSINSLYMSMGIDNLEHFENFIHLFRATYLDETYYRFSECINFLNRTADKFETAECEIMQSANRLTTYL